MNNNFILEKFEATQVGRGITPNQRLNKDIATLLCLQEPTADYVHDSAACIEALQTLGIYSYTLPTQHGKWVNVFECNGELCVTVAHKEESHAIAVSLFYALKNKSVVT